MTYYCDKCKKQIEKYEKIYFSYPEKGLDFCSEICHREWYNKKIALWKEIHPDFDLRLKESWEENYFTIEEVKGWIDKGLKPAEYEFANYLKFTKGFNFNSNLDLEELKKEREKYLDWTSIDENFRRGLDVENWEKHGFDCQATKRWKEVLEWSFRISDWAFSAWLRDEKLLIPQRVQPSDLENLRAEYNKLWINIHGDFAKESYQQTWEEEGLTYSEAERWVKVGLKPEEYPYIRGWKETGISDQEAQEWIEAGFKFSSHVECVLWIENNFTFYQAKSWMDIGLKPHSNDGEGGEFVAYLRGKDYKPSSNLNLKQLREEFNVWKRKTKPAQEYIQEHLDIFHPHEQRNTIKKIKISGRGLSGSLDLNSFTNLEELECSDNELTKLVISNCTKLRKVDCSNNKIHQDLSFLGKLVGLKELGLGNNLFYGSLEALKDMSELECLVISDTDIDSGLEYLPESVGIGGNEIDPNGDFWCSVSDRKDAKCKVILDLLTSKQEREEAISSGLPEITNFHQKLVSYKIKIQIEKELDAEKITSEQLSQQLINDKHIGNYIIESESNEGGYYSGSLGFYDLDNWEERDRLEGSIIKHQEELEQFILDPDEQKKIWSTRYEVIPEQAIQAWCNAQKQELLEELLVENTHSSIDEKCDVIFQSIDRLIETASDRGQISEIDIVLNLLTELKREIIETKNANKPKITWQNYLDHAQTLEELDEWKNKISASIENLKKEKELTKPSKRGWKTNLEGIDIAPLVPIILHETFKKGNKLSEKHYLEEEKNEINYQEIYAKKPHILNSQVKELPIKLYNIKTGQVEVTERRSDIKNYGIISYVWGNPNDPKIKSAPRLTEKSWWNDKLTVSGNKTLYKAIQTYEQWNKVMCKESCGETCQGKCENSKINYLWMDQLCINQENTLEGLAERNQEVPKMGQYYGNAAVTLISIQSKINEKKPLTIDIIEKIIQSEWFRRSWTFQEGWLSKNTLFMFDDMLVDGRSLAADWILYQPAYSEYSRASLGEISEGSVKVATPIGWTYFKDSYSDEDKIILTLSQVLRGIKFKERTLSIDGIYSVLGLLPYGSKVKPNYKEWGYKYTQKELLEALYDVMKTAWENGYGEALGWHGEGFDLIPEISSVSKGSTKMIGGIVVKHKDSSHLNFDPKEIKLNGYEYVIENIIGELEEVESGRQGLLIDSGLCARNIKIGSEEIKLWGAREALGKIQVGQFLVIPNPNEWESNIPFALLTEKSENNIYRRIGLVELRDENGVKKLSKGDKKQIVISMSEYAGTKEIPRQATILVDSKNTDEWDSKDLNLTREELLAELNKLRKEVQELKTQIQIPPK
jgi:hypothetical protein